MVARRRRKGWRWVVVALIVAGAVVLLLRETDEDRIRARLTQATMALRIESESDRASRQARIARAFQEVFAADAEVTIPDFPVTGGGREGLVDTAIGLAQRYDEVRVSFEHVGVRLDQSGHEARVQALVGVSAQVPGQGLRTDSRDAHLRLRKADGRWQVTSVRVAPPIDEEPEARP